MSTLPDDALILLPVRDLVLFPGMVVPIIIGRAGSIAAAQEAARNEQPIGVVLQRTAGTDDPGPEDLYRVGSVANILRYLTAPDGSHHVICQGVQRFRILDFLEGKPFLVARVEQVSEVEPATTAIEARVHQLRERAEEALQLMPEVRADVAGAVQTITSPSMLADLIAGLMDLQPVERQSILETFDVSARLDAVLDLMTHRIEVLKLSREIGEKAKGQLDQRQREFILREQMRQIQEQLGEADEKAGEIAELAEAIGRAGMPGEVEKQARKELKRLERMGDASGESPMLRSYLDWLIELPWAVESAAPVDIREARRILDADHFGLEKVKRRILEFLAVHKLSPEGKSPILCFVGPPGVGKTSLGQSIARASGRKFTRASLGGVHDEAEIRGHRRTYIGALPGIIIQNIRKAGTRDCVFMLDEMDKVGAGGFHGDPSSALLEVLDPEQNGAFRDNYLAVPFDLSRVMFIGTANVLDAIPSPLRDRMEVIELPGYVEDEKLEIARRYLVRRQLTANGLTAAMASVSDEALSTVIRDYTREAGCRNLEREIGALFRTAAVRIAEGEAPPVHIAAADVAPILGPRRFESEVALRTSVTGVATGLAWTAAGGDILFVEASRVPGSGKLILTGQLGDVMKESAQAALSLIKTKTASLGFDTALFEKSDIHIHVPAGAIPKDGPSAGVAMFIALASLLTDRPVSSELAMTGEISLRGLVLPVGGIKEKVVAAARAGLKSVMLPARNRKDFDEVPASAREAIAFRWIEHVDEALDHALGLKPAPLVS